MRLIGTCEHVALDWLEISVISSNDIATSSRKPFRARGNADRVISPVALSANMFRSAAATRPYKQRSQFGDIFSR